MARDAVSYLSEYGALQRVWFAGRLRGVRSRVLGWRGRHRVDLRPETAGSRESRVARTARLDCGVASYGRGAAIAKPAADGGCLRKRC